MELYGGGAINTASHLPVLRWALERFEGPVLELGGGMYSTGLLNELAREGRPCLTIEHDPEWRAYLRKRFPHVMVEGHDFADEAWATDADYGVIFIDNGVGDDWQQGRADELKMLRHRGDIILVHDWHFWHDTAPLVRSFNHYAWYDPQTGGPFTAVVSDTEEFLAINPPTEGRWVGRSDA